MCVPKCAPLTDLFLDPNKVGMPYGIGSNPLENGLIKLGFNLVVIKIFVSWCHSRGVRRPYNRPPIDRGHLVWSYATQETWMVPQWIFFFQLSTSYCICTGVSIVGTYACCLDILWLNSNFINLIAKMNWQMTLSIFLPTTSKHFEVHLLKLE